MWNRLVIVFVFKLNMIFISGKVDFKKEIEYIDVCVFLCECAKN